MLACYRIKLLNFISPGRRAQIGATGQPGLPGQPVDLFDHVRPDLKAPGYTTAPAEAGFSKRLASLLRSLQGPLLNSPAAYEV